MGAFIWLFVTFIALALSNVLLLFTNAGYYSLLTFPIIYFLTATSIRGKNKYED